MHFIEHPEESYEEVFKECISKEEEIVKNRLLKSLGRLSDSTMRYILKMKNLLGHEIQMYESKDYLPVLEKELKWLYDSRLVAQNGPGRNYYDKFLVRSKQGNCCFCSYNDPTELDHFLPKGKFAQFAISPSNLVPVCHRCNKIKYTHHASSILDCFIHPFFENFDDSKWLHVRIKYIDDSPIALFYVESDNLSQDLIHRIEHQFLKLELPERYTSQAGRELSGKRLKFQKVFDRTGVEGLKEELLDDAESKETVSKNSWQSALYNGLSNDQRFLSMDWSL